MALRSCVVRVILKPLKWGFPHTNTDRSGVFAAHITLYGVIVFSSATKCDQSSHRAPTARYLPLATTAVGLLM